MSGPGPGDAAPPADRPDGAVSGRSHAAETRRLYASDWAAFASWCAARRLAALPADPTTVAAFLGAAPAALSHGALARRAAAIAARHRQAGHPSPTADPEVRGLLKAARAARVARAAGADSAARPARTARTARAAGAAGPRGPALPARLVRMAARCPGDLAGLRDRALLLLAAAGLEGERLLALDREHIRLTAQAAELAVGGPCPERLELARGGPAASCPVRALERWLDASDTRFGPVFRKVDRWGSAEHGRLRPDGLRRILQRRATAARPSRRTEEAAA